MASHHLIAAFFLSPCVVVDDVLRSNGDQAGNQVGRYPPIDNAYWPPAPAPAGASSSSGGFGPPAHHGQGDWKQHARSLRRSGTQVKIADMVEGSTIDGREARA